MKKNLFFNKKNFPKVIKSDSNQTSRKKMIDGKNTSLKERVYAVSKNQNKINEKYSSCITT